MKAKFIFSIIVLALVAGMLIVTLGVPRTTANVQAVELSTGKITTPTPLPTAIPGVSALAIQKYAQSGKIMTQQKFGIDISAANFRYENEEIKVDVCFQLPSAADWRVWDATLQTKRGNLLLSTIAPRELTETLPDGKRRVTTYGNGVAWNDVPHDGQPDYLCETLAFFSPASEINLREIDLTQVSLVIQSIGALPREGQECAFYLETVQSRLDTKGIGIKLDCVSQEGGAQVVIAQKPANMSQTDAEALVSKESVESFIVQGPWIFPSSSR